MDDQSENYGLERGPGGPVIALFCLIVGLIVGAMTYGLVCWETQTIGQSMVRAISLECFATLTLFSILGIVWSLFAPQWLGRLIRVVYGKLAFAVAALLLLGTCLFIYFRH